MFFDRRNKKQVLLRVRPGSDMTINENGEGSMETEFVDEEGNVVSSEHVVIVFPLGSVDKEELKDYV